MRHRHAGSHLGRDTAHRMSLYRNLVTDLLRYERITTTEAKARAIRPIAEKVITLGRRGDIHARRQALRFVYDTDVVARIFDDIGPRMAERPGGYLRITKLEARKGDAARMATIELVDYVDSEPAAAATAPSAPSRRRRFRRPGAAPSAAAAPAVGPVSTDEPPPDADVEMADRDETTAEVAPEVESVAEAEPGTGVELEDPDSTGAGRQE